MSVHETPEKPVPNIRIEHGNPTTDEIGVLIAVLAAAGGGGSDSESTGGARRAHWSSPGERLAGVAAARGGWRWSGMPR